MGYQETGDFPGVIPSVPDLLAPLVFILDVREWWGEEPPIDSPLHPHGFRVLDRSPGPLLATLAVVPTRRPLWNIVAEFEQEHRGGYMSVTLVVPPGQAGELYHVTAEQTRIAEPHALVRVHSQAGVVVVVQGAAECDLSAAPHSWSGQPLGKVQDVHEFISGVNRTDVRNAPISLAAFLGVTVYNHLQTPGIGV
jgi:hypothetical protein